MNEKLSCLFHFFFFPSLLFILINYIYVFKIMCLKPFCFCSFFFLCCLFVCVCVCVCVCVSICDMRWWEITIKKNTFLSLRRPVKHIFLSFFCHKKHATSLRMRSCNNSHITVFFSIKML